MSSPSSPPGVTANGLHPELASRAGWGQAGDLSGTSVPALHPTARGQSTVPPGGGGAGDEDPWGGRPQLPTAPAWLFPEPRAAGRVGVTSLGTDGTGHPGERSQGCSEPDGDCGALSEAQAEGLAGGAQVQALLHLQAPASLLVGLPKSQEWRSHEFLGHSNMGLTLLKC